MALGSAQPLREISTSKGGLCVGLTTLHPSCADCNEIRKPQPSGAIKACVEIDVFFLYN
jgi:hypothetical protein